MAGAFRGRARAAASAALVSGLLGVACGTGDSGQPGFAERDSAGVRIAENGAGSGTRWVLADSPALVVGTWGDAPGLELFGVRSAHRLADGRIVIANAGAREILVYDPRTGSVARAGRKGRGPGEFEDIAAMWPGRGDTVYVYDQAQARVTPFVPGGGLGEPVAVPIAAEDGFFVARGRFLNGAILGFLVRAYEPGGAAGVRGDSVTVVVFEPRDGTSTTIGRILFSQSYVRPTTGGVDVHALPFGRGGYAAVDGNELVLGENARYELRGYSQDGRLLRVVRRDASPLPVRAEDLAREQQAWAEGGAPGAEQVAARLFRELPVPATKPFFNRFLVSTTGSLWVEEPAQGPDAGERWSVFDRTGRLVAGVPVPPRFRLLEAGPNYLLGVRRDEEDVERVELYRFRSGPGGG